MMLEGVDLNVYLDNFNRKMIGRDPVPDELSDDEVQFIQIVSVFKRVRGGGEQSRWLALFAPSLNRYVWSHTNWRAWNHHESWENASPRLSKLLHIAILPETVE